jgi:hypothetical protein
MNLKKIIAVIVLSINSFIIVQSQVTNSPYTFFGAGQIEDNGFGVNKALGGTGIAFKSRRYLNNINPASYSGIDSLSFLFEFGVFFKHTLYESGNRVQTKYDGNIRYLAFGFRITSWWANSTGLVPYSSVGYTINSTKSIEGTLASYNITYNGSGGINQFYTANTFTINKNISAGINASYIFGSVTQTETAGSTYNLSGYSIQNINYFNNIYFDYGLQFSFYHDQWKYALGMVYGNSKKLKTSNDVTFSYEEDTVDMGSSKFDFHLPRKFGAGVGVEKSNKFRGGFDYEIKCWSLFKFSNPQLNARNSERYCMGLEYTPKYMNKHFGLGSITYRLGAYYKKTYLVIDETPINSKALTFGAGIPLKRELSVINMSVELGENGTLENGLIREKYWLAHLNITLHDLWFQKSKYD